MSSTQAVADGLKLVEECSGVGEVAWKEQVFPGVGYRVSRFQGMTHSGLPIPGLHRIEGRLALDALPRRADMVDSDLVLTLEDGRTMRLTLAAADGRVLTEGHGPSRCSCC